MSGVDHYVALIIQVDLYVLIITIIFTTYQVKIAVSGEVSPVYLKSAL